MVEGVANFNYRGRPLYQTDDDCPEIELNIMHTRMVWGRLGKLLRWEGVDPRVLEIFYREVEQAVLLFGLDTWVLLWEMEREIEVTHTGFLRYIVGNQAQGIAYGTWETSRAEVVRELAGIQSAMTYIWRRQGTTAHWVALRPIFEVCAGEKGYEGVGLRRDAWRHQEAEEKQLMATL